MVNVEKDEVLSSSSLGATVLILLEEYLTTFCFYDTKFYSDLIVDPYSILQFARTCSCPQQDNVYDCG